MSKLRPSKKRVFVAMSGGVDSSVAAYLLKKRDYDVIGVFMRCYNLDGCAERDAEDARRVAGKLSIPFYVWDFEEEYKKRVVNYMIDGYRKGITPNPDVMCNKEVKFGLFLQKALEIGGDYIATGHYVKLRNTKKYENTKKANSYIRNKFVFSNVFEAKDKNKDQSYFLWTLTQEQLRHCLFPIGDYLKSEVREIARKVGLPTAEKKDSQGVCFLGQVDLNDFLKRYIREKRGKVLNESGKILGEHKGAHFYTIGQRHIGISKIKDQKSNSEPVYVAEKNIKNNTLIVAEGEDNPALYKKETELMGINFINPNIHSLIRANKRIDVLARVRYRQPFVSAKLMLHASRYMLHFDSPVKFVAPGQSAVFYGKNNDSSASSGLNPSTNSGFKMLGGGIIV